VDIKTRITKEKGRLLNVFAEVDANKLAVATSLIDRAAFLTISLQDLETEINQQGWTEKYQNGATQYGVKRSAAADTHVSLTKNLTSIIKQLLDMTPPERRQESRLAAFLNDE